MTQTWLWPIWVKILFGCDSIFFDLLGLCFSPSWCVYLIHFAFNGDLFYVRLLEPRVCLDWLDWIEADDLVRLFVDLADPQVRNIQTQGNLYRDGVQLHQHHQPIDQPSDFMTMMLTIALQPSVEGLLHHEAAIRRRSPSPEASYPATVHRQSPSPLLRRIQDPISQPSFSSDNLPYDPLNPLEPPITDFLQYTTVTDRPIPNDPTSPISSAEAAPPPDKRPKSPSLVMPPKDRSRRSDISSALRTKSLPSSRRCKHHHRSRAHRQITEPIAAPITITPTVTLMEALPVDEPDNAASASRPSES